jgi:molybdenum cofactor biosynthesis enzyme MoaA
MNVKDFEIFKFADNIYTEFVNNGKVYNINRSPYLDIVLTDYCNSDCNFCIADLVHDKKVIDFDAAKEKILYAINKMNVREVLLLGGEPTMSKHLIPMIKFLKTLNLDKIVMTTNGIKLAQNKEYIEEVICSGLTNINVSFMNTNKYKQSKITNSKFVLTEDNLCDIYDICKDNDVLMRINSNIFKGNLDTISKINTFYNNIKACCDSVKFSPILPVDAFSVLNVKTKWCSDNLIDDEVLDRLFNDIETYYINRFGISIITNDLQFGFVKNSMIPLETPIILNWNFGKYTGMMKRVTDLHQINNIKLLSNGELSLSWNRDLPEYFIKTT